MNKGLKVSIVSAVIATSGLFVLASSADAGWGGKRGQCDRGDMMGAPGMMQGKGKFGPAMERELDLTAEEAKTLVSARLIMRGNDRLKVGQVTEKDGDTYLVDIVTVDNSLVRQIEVDRDNGLPRGGFKR
ncbi:MAG: hypothetical protein N0C81_11225 [Candidatus Thiodiazotropha lotti]|uniref:PepSY domain-containing protein n=1 Tax=Candidatus Thiodiazotropha lotti TaxID=2792787 RepID=A0A9E4N0T4_9GAMM|nr:hypothetical protein [Candidatus Thiodiazotropha lotti]ODC00114.1 hypothetical protein A3197_06960 [Candidatus Thiodiazotropha endoloripes]MCG7922245.1 hypothetical protein [Candidatus Thiodiazotropha lotti]MCG7931731.1 hypothetical protein [Candidatus Thiodiazotropha lotti]MCG7939110.1 hypothetical protein [Candidatus Thiodiazotropha lotti]